MDYRFDVEVDEENIEEQNDEPQEEFDDSKIDGDNPQDSNDDNDHFLALFIVIYLTFKIEVDSISKKSVRKLTDYKPSKELHDDLKNGIKEQRDVMIFGKKAGETSSALEKIEKENPNLVAKIKKEIPDLKSMIERHRKMEIPSLGDKMAKKLKTKLQPHELAMAKRRMRGLFSSREGIINNVLANNTLLVRLQAARKIKELTDENGKVSSEINRPSLDVTRSVDNMTRYKTSTISKTETLYNKRNIEAGMVDYMINSDSPDHEHISVKTMKKRWNHNNDSPDSRDWHIDLDGVILGVDEYFDVDGEDMLYPHSAGASARNTINCECDCDYFLSEDEDEEE